MLILKRLHTVKKISVINNNDGNDNDNDNNLIEFQSVGFSILSPPWMNATHLHITPGRIIRHSCAHVSELTVKFLGLSQRYSVNLSTY